jgi:hypothetical protein
MVSIYHKNPNSGIENPNTQIPIPKISLLIFAASKNNLWELF